MLIGHVVPLTERSLLGVVLAWDQEQLPVDSCYVEISCSWSVEQCVNSVVEAWQCKQKSSNAIFYVKEVVMDAVTCWE